MDLKKLADDILKTGFPSEFQAVAKLRASNWHAKQGEIYVDADSGQGREIDISAHLVVSSVDRTPAIHVWDFLVFEVKKSEKPWVIFTSSREGLDSSYYRMLKHCTVKSTGVAAPAPPFMRDLQVGRAAYVGFAGSGEAIYKALVGSFKAAHAAWKEAESHKERWDETSIDLTHYSPIVLVDGPLYRCTVAADGSIELVETTRVCYDFGFKTPNYSAESLPVEIVTLVGLPALLDERRAWIETFHAALRQRHPGNPVADK